MVQEEGSGVNGLGHRGRWAGWPWWEARGHEAAARGHAHLPESEEVAGPGLQVPTNRLGKGWLHIRGLSTRACGGWAWHQWLELGHNEGEFLILLYGLNGITLILL